MTISAPAAAKSGASPRRLTVLAFGSTGDVLPYLALAIGLRDAGYGVRVVTHVSLASLARSHQLEVVGLATDPREVLDAESGRALLESGTNALRFGRRMLAVMVPLLETFAAATLECCRDTDAIIGSGLAVFFAAHVAEKLNVPLIPAYVQPLSHTTAFRSPFVANPLGRGEMRNWLTHVAYWNGSWAFLRSHVNRLRYALDLSRLGWHPPFGGIPGHSAPVLYGFSPSVLPKPSDWTSLNIVTGYWFLPPASDWQPPAELMDFLDAGPPPVSVGFGSMTDTDAERTTTLVLDALARTGQRGILLTGWGGLTKSTVPKTVRIVDAVPHGWLFPRTSAVVHHGGAGTTAAALRAGVPSVVVPFFGDQFFWGDLVCERGVGPAPIPRQQLTIDKLVRALTIVRSDDAMRGRAQALGSAISREDGVQSAVATIDELLQGDYANSPAR